MQCQLLAILCSLDNAIEGCYVLVAKRHTCVHVILTAFWQIFVPIPPYFFGIQNRIRSWLTRGVLRKGLGIRFFFHASISIVAIFAPVTQSLVSISSVPHLMRSVTSEFLMISKCDVYSSCVRAATTAIWLRSVYYECSLLEQSPPSQLHFRWILSIMKWPKGTTTHSYLSGATFQTQL